MKFSKTVFTLVLIIIGSHKVQSVINMVNRNIGMVPT